VNVLCSWQQIFDRERENEKKIGGARIMIQTYEHRREKLHAATFEE
jgi:hypothetical protein